MYGEVCVRPVEGVQQGELCIIFLHKVIVEIGKFDLQFAGLEVDVIVEAHCLFGVKHGVEGLKVGISFWIVGLDAVLRSDLYGAGVVEGGL